MITLEDDRLKIRFPHIGDDDGVMIDFQRTLRLPDDGKDYHLPPGLGRFPLRHIEDCDLGASEHVKERGGAIMPMFQTDALWLNFDSFVSPRIPVCPRHEEPRELWSGYYRLLNTPGLLPASLPVALKIGAGKINAVSGKKWTSGLSQDPQDYVVVPSQPWLDGFNVAQGVVRQFVAMPLGQGYTVEEQVDPESDVGGLQIEAFPMKKDLYEELVLRMAAKRPVPMRYSVPEMPVDKMSVGHESSMGLGMGGSMRQKIYEDRHGLDVWDTENRLRCFVMLANANQWMSMTGEEPPLSPISAEEYSRAGLPWFDYYDGDRAAIKGAKRLGKIKTIRQLARERRSGIWPEVKAKFDYVVKKIKRSRLSDGSW